jgi:hypothetical protein
LHIAEFMFDINNAATEQIADADKDTENEKAGEEKETDKTDTDKFFETNLLNTISLLSGLKIFTICNAILFQNPSLTMVMQPPDCC